MNPVYRQVIAIILVSISLIITCNKCQKRRATQQWGPAMEKQMSDTFYQQAGQLTDNEALRKQYAACCLSKMKELFPNGIDDVAKRMDDNLQAKIVKMGADCAKILSITDIWNKETEQQLKLRLFSLPEVKLLPDSTKEEYVNCLSYKIVLAFPHGLETDSAKTAYKAIVEKHRTDCLKLLVNKYGKDKTPQLSK